MAQRCQKVGDPWNEALYTVLCHVLREHGASYVNIAHDICHGLCNPCVCYVILPRKLNLHDFLAGGYVKAFKLGQRNVVVT